MAEAATLWGSLSAALAALVWVLLRRLKRARRIMPKGRLHVELSIQSPSTDPPERRDAQLSEEPPPLEHMPVDLDPRDVVQLPSVPPARSFPRPRDDEEVFSERPTPPKPRRRPR